MADQSVALQIKDPDIASTLASAQTIQGNQTALQAGRTNLEMLNRQNAGQDIQYRSQLIRDAAAHALDADSWNTAMNAAAQKGAPEAAQYVGRYTPLLQQRLFDAYGGTATPGTGSANAGANGTAATATPTAALDRTYQNVPPAQMGEILRQGNVFLRALATVKDQASQDQAAAALRAVGIPDMALRGPYSPLKTVQLWNEVSQRNNYLAGRLTPGTPSPPVKTDMQVVNGVGYDPYNPGKALTPPDAKKIGTDEMGRDVFGVPDPNAPGGYRRIDPATLGTGIVTVADAANRIQGIENGTGNPAAKNPRSSAMGNGQFTKDTWLGTFKEARPELAKSLTDSQILALRADPQLSSDMTAALATKNAEALTKSGLPVTTASLALAHRFGTGDATKIMNAPPSTPMEQLVSPDVLKANPELRGQTAGSVALGIRRQVGNDPVSTGVPQGQGQNLDLHGEEFLNTLPANKRDVVRQIVEGRSPYPSGFIMKTPYGQWLSNAVAQAEPGFNAAMWNARNTAYREWTAGGPNSPAGILTSGNTAIQHLEKLSDAAEKLQNWSGFGVLNKPLNALTTGERELAQDPRVSNFNSIRNKYIEEATKFYRGTGGNEADLQRDIASLNAAQSPEQLRQAIAMQAELMESKINALQARWKQANTTYGGRVIAPPFPIVQPQSQIALDKIKSREGATGSAPAAGAPAPVPETPKVGGWAVRQIQPPQATQ